jgi:hypothetical protein
VFTGLGELRRGILTREFGLITNLEATANRSIFVQNAGYINCAVYGSSKLHILNPLELRHQNLLDVVVQHNQPLLTVHDPAIQNEKTIEVGEALTNFAKQWKGCGN